jgi:hypothetical protein
MDAAADSLRAIVAAELRQQTPAAVVAMCEEIGRRHRQGIVAILFYGSCLRRSDPAEGVLDFYLLVDDYRRFYGGVMPALANAALPPNVFYAECAWNGVTLRAKYAVVSLRQFQAGTRRQTLQSSLWARFSQPARLVRLRDAAEAAAVEQALSEAVVAMVAAALPLLPERFDPPTLWQTAFQSTYGAELRSEGPQRAVELYTHDRARYDAVTPHALQLAAAAAGVALDGPDAAGRFRVALPAAARRRGRWLWRLRRPLGKLLNLGRLIKGGFTFSGGLDYILWKVERHSGVRVAVSPWQRRHPLLGAPAIAWQLYRRGGFR